MKYSNRPLVNKTYGPFSGSAVKDLEFTLKETICETVSAALYEYVKLRVEQNVRCLASNDYFNIEDLVGADCWAELDDDDKSNAALCIGYLYLSGSLPLCDSGFGLIPPQGYHLDSVKKVKAK